MRDGRQCCRMIDSAKRSEVSDCRFFAAPCPFGEHSFARDSAAAQRYSCTGLTVGRPQLIRHGRHEAPGLSPSRRQWSLLLAVQVSKPAEGDTCGAWRLR
jgi:hypothetical protein